MRNLVPTNAWNVDNVKCVVDELVPYHQIIMLLLRTLHTQTRILSVWQDQKFHLSHFVIQSDDDLIRIVQLYKINNMYSHDDWIIFFWTK